VKVYLAVPLQKNRNNVLAKSVSGILLNLGCKIISEWVLWDNPNPNLDQKAIYERNCEAIKSCELLIAELSNPSIGVGMEIMFAHGLGKKIICIYSHTEISSMVRGLPGAILLSYKNLDDLKEKLDQQFDIRS